MKATINSHYIRSISQSANFEKRVSKVLPSSVESINIYTAGLSRASGYNSYYNYIEFDINGGKNIHYKFQHNSSLDWDTFQDLEFGTNKCSNFMKQFIINMLEFYFQENGN